MSLTPFAENLWIKRIPYRFYGLPMGTRMTVVRLSGGELWIHTPLRLDASLLGELSPLGAVKYLIAPNRLHDLYDEDFTAVPGSAVFASPELFRLQRELPWAGCLTELTSPPWRDSIDQAFVAGSSWMDEVVFFHRPSKTLILADLLEHFDRELSPIWRPLAALGGVYGRYGLTRDQRMLIRDRAAFRASLERILEWPFERIVLSHGPLVERDGRGVFEKAFDWILNSRR